MLINHKKDSETHRERTAVEDHCASYKIQVLREKIVDCNCCHQYRSEFGKGRALATMKRLLKMKKKKLWTMEEVLVSYNIFQSSTVKWIFAIQSNFIESQFLLIFVKNVLWTIAYTYYLCLNNIFQIFIIFSYLPDHVCFIVCLILYICWYSLVLFKYFILLTFKQFCSLPSSSFTY